MVSLAAAGAISRASTTSEIPFGRRITMKAPPPRPEALGFITPWQKAVATTASTALPPLASVSKPVQGMRF